MRSPALLLAVALMSGCSTMGTKVAEAPQPPYEQLLENGREAQKAGNQMQALEAWRAAAKQNPSAKEPWLRMAQMHFDAADYGNAITAAQEVLHRDSTDAVANGLLAVSGLRVSSEALARMHTDNLQGSTRSEAESLAKTLRELLGAPVLVPQPANAATASSATARPARSAKPPVAKASEAAPAVAAKAPTSKPADAPTAPKATAQAPSRDPFGALR
jgi:tetratricopeptide (TPR) repeat protein